MAGSGTEGGKIQVGVLQLVKVIKDTKYMLGEREDRGVVQEEDRYKWEYW